MSTARTTPDAFASGAPGLRIDKWLWYARFFKSRTLAARHCAAGHVRINGTRVVKAHAPVVPGDVLTFASGVSRIHVVRVLALGTRRGPAPEARTLYHDLEPPVVSDSAAVGDGTAAGPRRARGSGRPTKSERRALERLRGEC
ncbi:MAG: RNA-binding S4 domain-containing protein [Alphaproteobacteria bacterium]